MESVIPCEPNSSRDSLLSPTDSQQAVDYRDFCYMYEEAMAMKLITFEESITLREVVPHLFMPTTE